jgi:hypothetical protein
LPRRPRGKRGIATLRAYHQLRQTPGPQKHLAANVLYQCNRDAVRDSRGSRGFRGLTRGAFALTLGASALGEASAGLASVIPCGSRRSGPSGFTSERPRCTGDRLFALAPRHGVADDDDALPWLDKRPKAIGRCAARSVIKPISKPRAGQDARNERPAPDAVIDLMDLRTLHRTFR